MFKCAGSLLRKTGSSWGLLSCSHLCIVSSPSDRLKRFLFSFSGVMSSGYHLIISAIDWEGGSTEGRRSGDGVLCRGGSSGKKVDRGWNCECCEEHGDALTLLIVLRRGSLGLSLFFFFFFGTFWWRGESLSDRSVRGATYNLSPLLIF